MTDPVDTATLTEQLRSIVTYGSYLSVAEKVALVDSLETRLEEAHATAKLFSDKVNQIAKPFADAEARAAAAEAREKALREALGAVVTEINRQPDPAAVPARVWSAKVVAERVLVKPKEKSDDTGS